MPSNRSDVEVAIDLSRTVAAAGPVRIAFDDVDQGGSVVLLLLPRHGMDVDGEVASST